MDPVWEWGRRTCSSTVPDSSQRRHGEVRPLAVLVDDVRGVLVPLMAGWRAAGEGHSKLRDEVRVLKNNS